DAEESRTTIKMSVTKATGEDIKSIPSIGGDADIATYFQTVPGVVTTGDQGGQMYVRGGSPIQNKVLLDGMIIYNPFHSIGFFSVFETEIIRNADIYTGGFNAEYGGRISSIMDITTRDGNQGGMKGRASVSPFMAKILLEGPLKKPKELGDGSISYILTGKHSYLDQSSKVLYPYIDTTGEGLPFGFTDLYGKISFKGRNGSKINLFGFNFTDFVNYKAVSDLSWNSYGVGTNFLLVPGTSKVLIEGKVSLSDYKLQLIEENGQERKSGINSFNFGFDFKYFIKENELKYGIEVSGFGTDFSYVNSTNAKIEQNENTTELGSYLSYRIVKPRLVIEPSLRLQYYATLNTFSPEPRLGIKYNIDENLRVKFAAGMYSQNLISANSDRDVVNLFYGFLSGPDNLQETFTDEEGNVRDVTHSLQKANHLIAGFEYDVSKKININVEGYYKRFTQLTNINRNKIFNENSTIDAPDILKKDYLVETGDAFGVDFVAKYTGKKTYLYAVYSLGKVTRWDGVRTYSPVFDRRHSVNLIGTYKFGKKSDWQLNARWNFGSGLPFTQTQGYYQNIDFAQGSGTDITQENANELTAVYAGLNEGRLPTYHRFDVNIKKSIEFKKATMELNFGITNVYNRENIFYVDRVSAEKVYQLPILPSFGIAVGF
ncbi:MAG: TonB-dependent receptor, partial [Flavobacteriales bacterium]